MKNSANAQIRRGNLLVVGSGIGLAGQCTIEARSAIEGADVVFAQTGDALVQQWLESLNPSTHSLQSCYEEAADRPAAYEAMVDVILESVRTGLKVCAVFYGHPGVFVYPSHEAVRRARAEGYFAKMLPGVSAEDCLFADLGVDPADTGCQSYEARDFLLTERRIDPAASLILWQIAVAGDDTLSRLVPCPRDLNALTRALLETHPPDHEVVVYAAAILPVEPPQIERMRLADLPRAPVSQSSTLYVPPLTRASLSPRRRALLDACLGGGV